MSATATAILMQVSSAEPLPEEAPAEAAAEAPVADVAVVDIDADDFSNDHEGVYLVAGGVFRMERHAHLALKRSGCGRHARRLHHDRRRHFEPCMLELIYPRRRVN